MTDINPEAYELRKRSGNSPADLDAAAEFYDRLRQHAERLRKRSGFIRRLTQSGPYVKGAAFSQMFGDRDGLFLIDFGSSRELFLCVH